MKRGDTARPFLFLLKPDGVNAMSMTDVSGYSVKFILKINGSIYERVGEIVNGSEYGTSYSGKAVARYFPVDQDTAEIGVIQVEVELKTDTDKIITFPSVGYISVNIEQDLNPI
jgi:hypothetical protein